MTWAKRRKGCDVVNPFMMAEPAVTLSEPCFSEIRPETSNGERKRQERQLCQQLKAAYKRLSFVACEPGLRKICHRTFELEPPAGARSDGRRFC